MQGDPEEVRKEIEEIIARLEKVGQTVKLRPIERAIEELKIAVKEFESRRRKGSEGFDHYQAKIRLIEELTKDGGACYLESEQTKLSKIGYRPDAVIIKEDEVIFVEIETDQRRMIKKLKKIRRLWNEITSSPITTGRRIRVVFGVLGDVGGDVLREVRNMNVEIYSVRSDRLDPIVSNPTETRA